MPWLQGESFKCKVKYLSLYERTGFNFCCWVVLICGTIKAPIPIEYRRQHILNQIDLPPAGRCRMTASHTMLIKQIYCTESTVIKRYWPCVEHMSEASLWRLLRQVVGLHMREVHPITVDVNSQMHRLLHSET